VDRVEQIVAAGTGGSSTPPPVRRRRRRPVLVVAGVAAALVLVTVGGILWAGLAPDAAKPACILGELSSGPHDGPHQTLKRNSTTSPSFMT
jgi:hypothetical protein